MALHTTMKTEILEALRKSRSINDIISVVEKIATSIRKHKKSATDLKASLSAKDEEIQIDRTAAPTPARRRKTETAEPSTGVAKIVKFTVPPKDKLIKNSDVVRHLYENVQELEAAEALIKQGFSGAKATTALKAIQSLKAEAEAAIQKAFEALGNVAEKHIPTHMSELGDALAVMLKNTLDKASYTKMSREIYVMPIQQGRKTVYQFAMYYVLENLKNSQGFVFDEYCLIFTGIVDSTGGIQYYLNAVPDFKVPGRYPLGREVEDKKEMLQRARMLLQAINVSLTLSKKALPVDTERARVAGFKKIAHVADVTVDDDSLNVKLAADAKGPRVVNGVIVQVMGLLGAIVGKSAGKIIYKIKKNGATQVIEFSLIPNRMQDEQAKRSGINKAKLDELQHVLDLDEHEVKALKQLLK